MTQGALRMTGGGVADITVAGDPLAGERAPVDVGQPLGGDLGVDAGRVGALVAEEVLDGGKVAGLGDQVGREPGPEAVRRDAGLAGLAAPGQLPDDLADALRGQWQGPSAGRAVVAGE